MRKILSDYDGIWIDTEMAKAARWYFAAMLLRGDDLEINDHFIQSIARRGEEARRKVERLVAERAEDLKRAKQHAGGPKLKFATRVRNEFLRDIRGEATEAWVKEKEKWYLDHAESIREPLIEWLSVPILGNLQFFKELQSRLRDGPQDKINIADRDKHHLGLVTQTESATLHKQFHLRKEDGSSIWGEFFELLSAFGTYTTEEGFPFAEAAGDYAKKSSRPHTGQENVKVVAYQKLCEKLGVQPEETLTFEDTQDGVRAAREAKIVCIGVKAPDSTQDFSEADLVIDGTLETLTEVTHIFVQCGAQETVEELERQQLGRKPDGR